MLLYVVALVVMVNVYGILGCAVLAFMPTFRITLVNIVVFIFAAYLGALFVPIIPYGPFTLFNWPGALLVGTLAVFLKTLLFRTSLESRWL